MILCLLTACRATARALYADCPPGLFGSIRTAADPTCAAAPEPLDRDEHLFVAAACRNGALADFLDDARWTPAALADMVRPLLPARWHGRVHLAAGATVPDFAAALLETLGRDTFAGRVFGLRDNPQFAIPAAGDRRWIPAA